MKKTSRGCGKSETLIIHILNWSRRRDCVSFRLPGIIGAITRRVRNGVYGELFFSGEILVDVDGCGECLGLLVLLMPGRKQAIICVIRENSTRCICLYFLREHRHS